MGAPELLTNLGFQTAAGGERRRLPLNTLMTVVTADLFPHHHHHGDHSNIHRGSKPPQSCRSPLERFPLSTHLVALGTETGVVSNIPMH